MCLLYTWFCMTDSTVRSNRFVCSIYVYGRIQKAVSWTHILTFSHAVTWSQKQVGGWETIPKNLEKKKLFLKTRARTLPPSPVKKMIVTRSATIYISTTLLFWFISGCISIFLDTFQCSYKRIDILVCFWISFYVCHFSKR